jgi:ribosomal protein S17E
MIKFITQLKSKKISNEIYITHFLTFIKIRVRLFKAFISKGKDNAS